MRLAVVLALAGCVVTRPPRIDERPRWYLASDATWDSRCVSARPFVRKSGKLGFGVALQLRSRMDCTFQIVGATLTFAHGSTETLEGMPPVHMIGRSQLYAWLPVAFDNNAAWNAHDNDATLALAIKLDGEATPTFTIPVMQR